MFCVKNLSFLWNIVRVEIVKMAKGLLAKNVLGK